MDPVITPFALLFLGTLGLILGPGDIGTGGEGDDGWYILFNGVVIANVIGDQELMPDDITLNAAIR